MRIIARGVGNLPTNLGVPRTFRSRLIGQDLSDASRDLGLSVRVLWRHATDGQTDGRTDNGQRPVYYVPSPVGAGA